jgi:hypothetical protein
MGEVTASSLLCDPVDDLLLPIHPKTIEIEWGLKAQCLVLPQEPIDLSCLLDLTPHRFDVNISI